jgi:hypothetical protein
VEARLIVLVRRTPEEAAAWLDALDDPDTDGPDARRWRRLNPEARQLVRDLAPGGG